MSFSDIDWGYTGPSNTKRWFPRKHDTLLFYVKSEIAIFNRDAVRVPYKKLNVQHRKTGGGGIGGNLTPENVDVFRKRGKVIEDWWVDISPAGRIHQERCGYPTQKPLALLERIIKASSVEGDVVLDPFCGCATTCVAAERLGRDWVGIDLSPLASTLVRQRLERASDEGALFKGGLPDVIVREDIPCRTDIEALPDYRSHKHVLYGEQKGTCGGCGIHFPFRNMTVDHIIPQSKGGGNHKGNLQLLCGACNSQKGAGTQAELMAKLRRLKLVA